MLQRFSSFEIKHVFREANKYAGAALANTGRSQLMDFTVPNSF
jgi:hypothetical protein